MSVAFLFPGQGAQKLKMMAGFADNQTVKSFFKIASNELNVDFWALLEGEDADTINKTVITQPLLLTVETAVYQVYLSLGGKIPDYMAGHSLGEYSALVAANALDFKDALQLVQTRANLMQAAVPEGQGAMAAVLGLDDESVRDSCAEAEQQGVGVVQAANYNSINQVVIAGDKKAVEVAMSIAKEKGAKKSILVPVSVPSHCALMQEAAQHLAKSLQEIEIKPPQVPVIHNVDVASYDNPLEIKDALIRQLYSPVRWTETILFLQHANVVEMVECAPAKVLTDLNKRIVKAMNGSVFSSEEAITNWIQTNSSSI